MSVTDTTLSRPRKRRFKRAENPRPIRIIERDLNMLHNMLRFRFLNTDQIAALDGGSEQQAKRRARRLYDHGYLDKPRSQISLLIKHNNPCDVYALAQKGARLLSDCHGLDVERYGWCWKNKKVGDPFIAHTIATSDFMVALEHLCGDENNPNLIDHDALLPFLPLNTQRLKNPFAWRARDIAHELKKIDITNIPDRVFSLVFADNTRLNFAVEIDTGTMSVWARSLTKSSIRRKLKGYHAGFQNDLHKKLWGFERVRFLFVTTSEKRVETMLETARKTTHARHPGLFLFADRERLSREGIFAPVWSTMKDDTPIALF